MLKGIFLVFIAGWVAWFWIDKPPAGQFELPPASDSLVENFQRSFNLLKAGYPDMAYLYIWHAHYLILSAVLGILAAIAFGSLSDHLARKRMRRHSYPLPDTGISPVGKNVSPERPVVTPDDDKASVNSGSSDHLPR
jgi:hypothetical protein